MVPIGSFLKDKHTQSGLGWRCQACANIYAAVARKRYVQKNLLKSQTIAAPSSTMKLCKGCGVEKRCEDFPIDRHMPGGRYHMCKVCKCAACKIRRDALRAARNRAIEPALYVMRNPLIPTMVKIGQAIDVAERASQLSSSHPFDLEICFEYPAKGHLEPIIHDRLRAYRFTGTKASKGREWFEVQPEQADGVIRGAIAEWELANP